MKKWSVTFCEKVYGSGLQLLREEYSSKVFFGETESAVRSQAEASAKEMSWTTFSGAGDVEVKSIVRS
jgi:hypothetical protein